jgi:hypothetical protein
MIGIVWATEPPFPPKQLGKIVPYQDGLCYCYDGVAVYNRLQALGVAECVLVEMIRNDIRHIFYTLDGTTYTATRDTVLAEGFRDTMNGGRRGYLYTALKHWKRTERPHFPWVPAKQVINMGWLVDAFEIDDWRRALLAARPVKPVQGTLWA